MSVSENSRQDGGASAGATYVVQGSLEPPVPRRALHRKAATQCGELHGCRAWS